MSIAINILKTILIRLALKYGAELLFNILIEALKKASKSTDTTIDDDVVAVIEKEKEFIVKTINGGKK